jgi:hypothetical protein
MGVWYGVQGSVKCRDTRRSRKVLAELTDGLGEIEVEVEDHDDKTFTVEINGGMYCSYGTSSDVDDKIAALGPFAVAVGYFETLCEDEKGDLWVGKPADVEKAIRVALVRDAREALKKLTAEEAEELLSEAQAPHFWIGKR